MLSFTILLVAAAVGFSASRKLRLPVIPVLMITGALLHILGIAPSEEMQLSAIELGITVLAFTVGLELNPQRFATQRGAVLWVGAIQMFVVGAAGFGLGLLMGFSQLEALYCAALLAASSTLVVLRHLKQQGQLFEPFGRLVIGVMLLQDAVMILVIVALSRAEEGWLQILLGVAVVMVLYVVASISQRRLMPAVILRWKLDEESLLLGVLALLFLFAGVAFNVGVPPLSGAFMAGFALSAFPINGVVRGLTLSISDFFLSLFFVALGTVLTVPSGTSLLQSLVLAGFVLLVTPPVVTALAEWKGLTARASVESGLLLAQASEFSLVAILSGVALGHLSPEVSSMLALAAVISMTLTPFIATDAATRRLLRLHPLRRHHVGVSEQKDHVLILGFGAGGMWVIRPLLAAGHNILVVDDDPAVIEQLDAQKIPNIRGDGSERRTLERAGARQAKLIIASMRRADDSLGVISYASPVPVVVRVFENEEADAVSARGGIPILNSMAAADTFMDWFRESAVVARRTRKLQSEPHADI